MPKLKVIFTQETIISRKEIIQIEYSPESRITSSRQSKKTDEKEKSGTMIAVIVSQVRKG